MAHPIRLAALLAALAAPAALHAQEITSDVRVFRVGMPVSALPPQGYAEFRCGAGGPAIAGWAEYRSCPADATGAHEVAFRYADNGEHETKIAGQPVLLSLLLTDDGIVQAIKVQTDPSARLFVRKRGYIFGEQVMARYGEEGWACKDTPHAPGEEPVGGVFVHERCEKTLPSRHLVVEREFFHPQDKNPHAFTSATTFTVSLVKAGQG